MKRILLLFILLTSSTAILLAQTTLEGKVTDAESGEPILFGTVALYKNGNLITGAETDLDGNYFFADVDPGTYELESSYLGYTTERKTGVIVKAGKTNRVNFMLGQGVLIDIVVITEYKVPLIEIDNTTQGGTVTAEQIRSLPNKNINAIAAQTAGISSTDGGAINVRGSRSNATVYFIDGVRVSGLIPQSEIEQLQIITGGIEAKYGDVTGGIISLTTKGPSRRFSGGVEVESSEYLDGYGYNLVSGNVSGPLWKNSEGKSIIGFRVSGQLRKLKENAPRANGVYAASESVIAQLEENPTYSLFGTDFPSGELLTDNDIGPRVTARPNEENVGVDLTGKLDFRVSDNIDISLSGSYNNSKNRFTPSTGWSLLNWQNNPYGYGDRIRGNLRLRHKIGRQRGSNLTDEEKAARSSSIRNLSYTLQLGYEQSTGRNEDLRHEDRLFEYGYLGNISRSYTPAISIVPDTSAFSGPEEAIIFINGLPFAHQAFSIESEEIDISNSSNPVLAKYNDENGRLINSVDVLWGDLYSNVGQVYNNFSKNKSDRYTFNLVSGFDFLPGGSEKGRHSIQFGVTYEQRINRGWSISPFGLWVVAANQANNHIDGIDYSNAIGTTEFNGFTFPTYAAATDPNDDAQFYLKVRELLGLGINEYVNVDAIDPGQLTLDMFSASELNNEGIINYYGYDYLGNEIGTDVKFEDFFTSTDEVTGQRTFVVAPDQPIYSAGFIQDKFSYKDIIFRIGVRADYYDANTKVLKDPYSLYDIQTAGDFFKGNPSDQPVSVDDNYKVYVDGEGSTNVLGYRSGDTWFTANGTATTDNVLFDGIVYPAYEDPDADIRDPNFNPADESFEDYTPQINFMPRLAFSFPISEDAGFFAHYDVLYQRPPSNTIQTALDYYFFNDIGRLNPGGAPANNSNLKPVRTIDYEVGFQQKLSQTSALKISAYYKELKDLIQRRFYTSLPAPLGKYETFANLDFGTVKGFTFTYDKRRTGPLEYTVSYTLQFADGSGSNANSSGGINDRGPLRTLIPLSYDERHRLTSTLDFRYDSGKKYTGPTIAGIDIFSNMGANLTLTAVSGKPYTARANASEFGGVNIEGALNGARLPWTYSADLRIDKSFSIKLTEEAKRSLNFNVYLRVQNLLDTRNVIGVYSYSGDPDNDGFLVSSQGIDRIEGISTARNIEAFLDAYNWRLNNPGNYTRPRRIYLGMILDF